MASKWKIAAGVVGGLVGFVAIAAGGGWLWMNLKVNAQLTKVYDTHTVDFPVPFPLSDAEIESLRAERSAAMSLPADPSIDPGAIVDPSQPPLDPLEGVDLGAVAMERAIERGRHLITSRYGCSECHGFDMSGGVMMDVPAIAVLKGPNLTLGQGSRTAAYTVADWDRMVRHGVKPDGTATFMPSEDFVKMSDRELSDVIAYIRSMPPVDNEVPLPEYGPMGTVLVALGQIPMSADKVDHHAAHAVEAPPEAVTVEFGAHIANVCTGCHRPTLEGGPMVGGDPSWAVPANLTPHKEGLGEWSFEQFEGALRRGIRPDGTPLKLPMNKVMVYTSQMTDTEMRALWMYLQTVEPRPDGA